MGCVPSTPQQPVQPPPRSQRSQQPSAARKQPQAAAADAAAPAYETEVSASLSEGGSQSVAYHNLLNPKAISLVRSSESPLHKLVERSLQPSAPHNHDEQLSVVRGVAMTMPYTIIVAKPDSHDHVSYLVTAVFEQYNAVLNAWNAQSEVSSINALAPGKKMPLSPELEQLFSVVDNVFEMTDTRFDPTTAVLNIAFENCIRDNNRPPRPDELRPYKHAVGWDRRVQRARNTVSRSNAHTIIDLDGISKGYVIDCIVQRLLEHGYQHVYVDWAADIRAVGNHPSGRPWRAAVIQPPQLKRVFKHWREETLPKMLTTDDISYLASLQFEGLHDISLATSGDYFCVQKYGYHHIASASGLAVMKANAKSVASVSIAASTCAVADAVATAAMTFDSVSQAFEFSRALCEKFPRMIYGYCVMGRDYDVHYSSIFEPLAGKSDKPSKEVASVEDGLHRVSPTVLYKLREKLYAGRAVVVRGSKTEKVDSLASLSISPEQLVSFHTTISFASDDDPNCECFILLDGSTLSSGSEGISLDLSVKEVYNVEEDGAVVVARIDKIRLGNVKSLKVVHNGYELAKKDIQLSCARSKFELAPLVDQCKDLFRNIASMIWIVTTTSADQQLFALTATSVSVSESMEDVLCFNILHTSTFYAAFGGVGSEVCLHALSSELQDLASKYTAQSDVGAENAKRLGSKSLATVAGSIFMVNDVQDHHIVFVRVRDVKFNDDVSKPLIWLQSNFV